MEKEREVVFEVKSIRRREGDRYDLEASVDGEECNLSIVVDKDEKSGLRFLELAPGYPELLDTAVDAFVNFHRDFWRYLSDEQIDFPLKYAGKWTKPRSKVR